MWQQLQKFNKLWGKYEFPKSKYRMYDWNQIPNLNVQMALVLIKKRSGVLDPPPENGQKRVGENPPWPKQKK